MIVQLTNTGTDLGQNHFDLQIPGGGVGIFDGCTPQWGGQFKWGQRDGGVSGEGDCYGLPNQLVKGCLFRFQWFKGASNPTMNFQPVACPAELTNISGCKRN